MKDKNSHSIDEFWMKKALALARKGLGRTSPNPTVGAVIVSGGKIIGKGYHKRAGCSHAEVEAVQSAIASCAGATLYVTLEPCSTFGRTPPCTDLIIKTGFKRVIAGIQDPNPKHAGKGIEILRNAGIEVLCGVLAEKCFAINEHFFYWIQTGFPFVTLKMAMTLDGKIATSEGESKWITGETARKRVDFLRLCSDAVLVGENTAIKDRPSLNVRSGNFRKTPRRLVATSRLSADYLAEIMPPGSSPEPIKARTKDEWLAVMKRLGEENVTSILVEGGGELAYSLLETDMVNKVEFHIAGKILGGRNSIPVIGGDSDFTLAHAPRLKNLKVWRLGEDIAVSGYLKSISNSAEEL